MGGNLISPIWGLPPKRLSRADYEELSVFLIEKLQAFAPERRFRVYRTFVEKESFGDIDILCESVSGDNLDWSRFFEDLSGYKPHKNGVTTSVPIKGFQCDFNFVGSEVYECAYNYMAMESGNFMGVIAHQMGLSYGHRGLYLKVPLSYFGEHLPDHEYREVLVSRDPVEVFRYLGFDYRRFEQGFRNFDEMAAWVAASKYFTPKAFKFETLNAINRTRNRKRPVYAKFVEWCESKMKNEGIEYKELPSKEFVRSILCCRSDIRAAFGCIKEEILKKEARHAKFNGNLVKELRGVEKEELGKFIVSFKKAKAASQESNSFDDWVDANSAAQIREDILQHNP